MNLPFWSVLGIEPTDDIRAIKRAYAALAHKISPEDEPEKFRKIHDAYKNALFYAEHKKDLLIDEDDDISEIRKTGKSDESGKSGVSGIIDEPDTSGEATVLEESIEIGLFPPVADTNPREASETEPGTGFDFSSLDLDSIKSESAADAIIDDIVAFREDNRLTSKEAVHDLPHDLAMHLSEKMFYMYEALADAANDSEVWDSFMEEPLIKYSLNFSLFRKWIIENLEEDCSYKDKLVQAFGKYEDTANNEEIIEISEAELKDENKRNRVNNFFQRSEVVVKIIPYIILVLIITSGFILLLLNKLTPERLGEWVGCLVLIILYIGYVKYKQL